MRMMTGLSLAAVLASASMASAVAMLEQEPEPGSAKNRPGGNTPVPGGGARERARRLARMAKQQQD